jgi:two-component system sensor histidine kinase HydH
MQDRKRSGHLTTGGLLFPRGVTVWHFILIPPLVMGAVIVLFRWITRSVLDPATISDNGIYAVARIVIISLVMSLTIAWLAFRHRREYEAQIANQNEDLLATRDFLSNVIETSGEVIITLDDDGRITSWNRTAREIYGWTQEEMLGQTCERMFAAAGDEISKFQVHLGTLKAGGIVHHEETTHRRKDGSFITVHITLSPLFDGAGRYVGATALIHDVTKLYELQTRLVEQERMAALGQMAAAVAHEIKNPLAGIRGGCEILLKGAGEGDPRTELGEEMLYQVDRLSRSVHDLLVFARPKKVKPVPTQIHLIVDRVLKMIAGDPKNKGIRVDRRYDTELGHVQVDPEMMEQVFFNVLLNSCQAMDLKGAITITTGKAGNHVSVSVRDTGAGIPDDVMARIFEPFFTTRAKGTGLGLAIVSKIIQDHGGTIRAVPPADGGAGTEVVIQLPAEA